jgi:hypothetical protein
MRGKSGARKEGLLVSNFINLGSEHFLLTDPRTGFEYDIEVQRAIGPDGTLYGKVISGQDLLDLRHLGLDIELPLTWETLPLEG